MMRMGWLMLGLTLAAVVAGCGGQVPLVTPELVAAAHLRWPSSSAESLARGRLALTTNCARCHRAPIPSDHSEAEWAYYLHEMAPRAQLQPDQVDDVLKFLYVARVPVAAGGTASNAP